MKLFLVIGVFCVIPFIEGFPGDYQQILEPRGITDSFISWFYDDPQNDSGEETSESDLEEITSQKPEISESNNPEVTSIQNENQPKVIPAGNNTPKRKVEPIEDLLAELNKEIKESNDEEKKNIFGTLTEIKDNLEETPSQFVNVLVNKAWRLVDIGKLGSSRRTRSVGQTINLMYPLMVIFGLIQNFLSIFGLNFSNNTKSMGYQSLIPSMLTNYFGIPADEKSVSVVGLQNSKDGKLNLEKGLGSQELIVLCLNKNSGLEADHLLKGKTHDETMNTIEKYMKDGDLDFRKKWYIILELSGMYDEDLDDETKKRIIHLILLICDDPKFQEIFDVIKDMEDPESKKIWKLFQDDKEKLKDKLNIIVSSLSSKEKNSNKKPSTKKTNKDPSTEYHVVMVDKHGNFKSDPKNFDLDPKKLEQLVDPLKEKDSNNIQSIRKVEKENNPLRRDAVVSPNTLNTISPSNTVPDAEPPKGTEESGKSKKNEDPSDTVRGENGHDLKHDGDSATKNLPGTTNPTKNESGASVISAPLITPGEHNIVGNPSSDVATPPQHSSTDPAKNLVDSGTNFNDPHTTKPSENHDPNPVIHEPHPPDDANREKNFDHQPLPSHDRNHDHPPINVFSTPSHSPPFIQQPPPTLTETHDRPSPYQPNHLDTQDHRHPSTPEPLPSRSEDHNPPSTQEPILPHTENHDHPLTYEPYHPDAENPSHSSTPESLPFHNENPDNPNIHAHPDENNHPPYDSVPPNNEYGHDNQDSSNDSPYAPNPSELEQGPILETQYPYTSDHITVLYYDPDKQTYIDRDGNRTFGDILNGIDQIVSPEGTVTTEMKFPIVYDLYEWNYANPMNEGTKEQITEIIKKTGENPKFQDLFNQMETDPNPTQYHDVLNLFGQLRPDDSHEPNHGRPQTVTHHEEYRFPIGNHGSNPQGYVTTSYSSSRSSSGNSQFPMGTMNNPQLFNNRSQAKVDDWKTNPTEFTGIPKSNSMGVYFR